jgi:hypothetical protein
MEEDMKTTTIFVLFALVLAGTAFAGDNGNGCKLLGTWVGEMPYPHPEGGYYTLKFFGVYHGTGDNNGTDVLDWINSIPDPGTKWSSGRGVWEKAGPNQYRYTLLGHIFDAQTGEIMAVVRHVGLKTLTDCNTMEVITRVEYLTPDMTQTIMCIPGEATLHRVVEAEPCECE